MPPVAPLLVVEPLGVARPWGGRRGHEWVGMPPPAPGSDPIGEWWLLSARPGRASRILGGIWDGAALDEVLREHAPAIVGARRAERWRDRFPLLLKIVDTRTPLSIQVHPTHADPAGEGKSESWYVLASADSSELWIGTREGVQPQEVVERARAGRSPADLLVRHVPSAGQVAHLPAGTIHALGADIVAVEIQESSDTTWRIWDWGREPARELHLDRALEVALGAQRDPADPRAGLREPRRLPGDSPVRDELIDCPEYRVERIALSAGSPVHLATDGEHFEILLPLRGSARARGPQGAADVPRGHALLVPAPTTDFVLAPNEDLELLRCVPRAGTAR